MTSSIMEDCGICKVPFDNYQHGPFILCNKQHIYCEHCVSQLFQLQVPKCPQCRQSLKRAEVHRFRQYLDWLQETKLCNNKLKQQKEKNSCFMQFKDAIREIIKQNSMNKDKYYEHIKQRAEALFQEGKNYAAIGLLEALIQYFPDQDRYTFIGLGSKEEQIGLSEGKPLSWFKEGYNVKQLSAQDLYNHILMETPSYKGSIDWYKMMTNNHPLNYRLFYGSALSKHRQNLNKSAISDFKRVLRLNPKNFKAECMIAFLEDDLVVALQYANMCLKQDQTNIFAKYIKAINSRENHIEYLSQIVEQAPPFVRALYQIGEQLHKKNLYDQAIAKYKDCLSVNSLFFEPNLNIGYAYVKQQKYSEAIQHVNTLLSYSLKSEQRSQVLRLLGTIHRAKDDASNSISSFKQSIGLDPLNDCAKLELAYQYRYLSKNQFAIKLYKEVQTRDPSNLEAIAGIADCFSKMGRDKEALTYFKKWIQLEPENISVKFQVANIYFRLKDWRNSVEYFLLCIKDNYQLNQAYPKAVESYYYLKEYKNALKTVQECFKHDNITEQSRDKVLLISNKMGKLEKVKKNVRID